MLRGLAYLHNKFVCHRDIKPQNILVDPSNYRLMICDFGSAKILKDNEKSISYICSRYYRAPELILGKEIYGCEIDLWSIGCVIAELYLGQPIFWGQSSEQQFLMIMNTLGNPTEEDIVNMKIPNPPKLPKVQAKGLDQVLKEADP